MSQGVFTYRGHLQRVAFARLLPAVCCHQVNPLHCGTLTQFAYLLRALSAPLAPLHFNIIINFYAARRLCFLRLVSIVAALALLAPRSLVALNKLRSLPHALQPLRLTDFGCCLPVLLPFIVIAFCCSSVSLELFPFLIHFACLRHVPGPRTHWHQVAYT